MRLAPSQLESISVMLQSKEAEDSSASTWLFRGPPSSLVSVESSSKWCFVERLSYHKMLFQPRGYTA